MFTGSGNVVVSHRCCGAATATRSTTAAGSIAETVGAVATNTGTDPGSHSAQSGAADELSAAPVGHDWYSLSGATPETRRRGPDQPHRNILTIG